jgi:outer membrane protein OmpA-like peptidoglycan-associated protein
MRRNNLSLFLSVFFFFFLLIVVKAQTLTLFDLDTSAYPTIKAKFYAMEKGKQLITLTKEEVAIHENSLPQQVIRVTNPAVVKPSPLSVVLTVDVSGSMAGGNIELAKHATKMLVDMLPLDISECAVTSFDDGNYLNLDFTKDAGALKSSLDQLKPNGGTDYNKGFTNSYTGAIDVAKAGANKKILIFLTDGLGDADEEAIVQKAKSAGVTIYCIAVGMPAPEVLKNIAGKTGGKYFENIFNKTKAAEIYQNILQTAQNSEPSMVEWTSAKSCGYYKKIDFSVPEKGMKVSGAAYEVPASAVIKADIKPQSVKFKNIRIPGTNDTSITLTAFNNDITVLSATSNNPSFSIVETIFPLVVKSGQSQKITLRYNATDSVFKSGRIELKNNICAPFLIFVNSGVHGKNAGVPIKVVQPNGKEVFYAGADTTISWSGVFPTDKVSLEFSKDNGKNWEKISSTADSNKFKWKVPFVKGNEMLVRASYNTGAKGSGTSIDLTKNFDGIAAFHPYWFVSPDNTKLLGESGKNMVLVETSTGNIMHTWTEEKSNFFFSQDGSQIYKCKEGSPTVVYDATTFEQKGELPALHHIGWDYGGFAPDRPKPPVFNKEGSRYIGVDNGTTANVYELLTGNLLYSVNISKKQAIAGLTENYLVTKGDENGITEVWDLKTKNKAASFKNPELNVQEAFLTEDEKYLAAWSEGFTGSPWVVSVFELATQKKLYSLESKFSEYRELSLIGDIMFCTANEKPSFVEIPTGKIIKTVEDRFDSDRILGIFSPDGSILAMASSYEEDKRGIIYSTGIGGTPVSGQDISDFNFSIVNPVLVSKDIKVGRAMLEDSKDSVMTTFISNKNKCKVEVKAIKFSGADASSFSIVSGAAPFIINANASKNVEFRFKPIRIGTHTAKVSIVTGFDTLVQTITGDGLEKSFSLAKDLINFGKVRIGSTRDTTAYAILKNTGSLPLVISKIENAGPDKIQFTLADPNGFILQPGESKNSKISFKPVKAGRTTTNILFRINGILTSTDVPVYAEGLEKKSDPFVVISGKVADKVSNEPLEAVITYTELNPANGAGVAGTAKSNPDGSYSITVPYGKAYTLSAEKKDHMPQTEKVDFTSVAEYLEITKDLFLSPLEVGKTINLSNVFFERGKPSLLPESYHELDILVKLLKDNPTLKIELSGHTDNVGDADKNLELSKERVEVIRKYLVEKGISQKRLSGKGYGGARPVASNAAEETRKLNRRVEFTVVGK